MKTQVYLAAVLLAGMWSTGASAPAAEDDEPEPSREIDAAGAILSRARRVLPRDPLSLRGELIVRRPRGVEVLNLRFAMDLDFGAVPPYSSFEIYDLEGRRLHRLRVTRSDPPVLRFEDERGRPPDPPPALEDRIASSDLTWLDLTLDFLWWPPVGIVGRDRIRGRTAHKIRVAPPEPTPDCDHVVLWLDAEQFMLLQAEQRDAEGRTVRRMWVRNIQKVDDRWMIRDIEVAAHDTGHRTRLHVNDVRFQP